jgi:hypothetical protein
MEEEATDSLRPRVIGAPATLDNDNEVLPLQTRKEENGNMSVGYSGWIALRREQCDLTRERRNCGVRRDIHCRVNK